MPIWSVNVATMAQRRMKICDEHHVFSGKVLGEPCICHTTARYKGQQRATTDLDAVRCALRYERHADRISAPPHQLAAFGSAPPGES